MTEGRLFFALWPEQKARDRLFMLAKRFSPQGGRLHHPNDLHITLVFLGLVDDERLPCIQQVAEAIDTPPFTLRIDTLGYWPRPRILWCGPTEQPEALQNLVKRLQHGLLDCGFEPEKRPYKPHVTLHRKVRHAQTGPLDEPIEWHAGYFVLATSGGGAPGQPRYRILNRWRLK